MNIDVATISYLLLFCNLVKLSISRSLTKISSDGYDHYNPEENIGVNLFLAEGDILIDRDTYYTMYGPEQVGPGEAHTESPEQVHGRSFKRQKRSVDSAYHLLWLNRSIPYEFDINFGPEARKLVEEGMAVLQNESCIRFKKRWNELDYIYIVSDEGSCYSKVGRFGGPQKLGLSSICPFGTVVHELLHATGLWHEHNRQDRDNYVNVLWDNIREGKKTNFHISKIQNEELIRRFSYDYGSIMHYSNNTFSKNGHTLTMKPMKPLPPGVEMGQRVRPSRLDMAKLNALYMCDIRSCVHPGLLNHGVVHGHTFTVGSKVVYTCQTGYTLIGAPDRVCLTIGQWSGEQPACLANSTNYPVHYCNFDRPRHSLCGWTQSKDDDTDWTLNSGATQTAMTGPFWDNTLNTASGVYLYVEASGSGMKTGATARLMSPRYDSHGYSSTCLVFFANMYGHTMGSLSVYVQEEGENTTESQMEQLFTTEGDHGNKWRQIFLVLGTISRPFYIFFEGSIGSGYSSDIAIDDITVGSCKSFKPLAISGGLQHNLGCSFDDGHVCQFLQDRHDTADWSITSGTTPTFHTGPDCDPLDCMTGKYLFLEASAPRTVGDTARLKTPTIGGQGQTCLSFYYHMYGEHIGSLAIKMVNSISGNEYTLWVKTGNQGNRWFTEFLEYNAPEAYKIVIEGAVGTSYRGDIAIDSINITSGGCTGLMNFDCSFEHDLCGWLNILSPGDTLDWTRHSGETDTPYTGPSSDRVGPDGYFLYVESSRSFDYDSAKLISPTIQQTQQGYCLSFWYHMYGAKTGNLTVYLQSEVGQEQVAWSASGDHGNHWLFQKVYVTSFPAQSIHVIFEVKLLGFTGDTAIDDVAIHRGPCVN